MNFKAVFQKINLNWSRKLTHNLTLPNVEFRTSWHGVEHAPRILCLFIPPPANFRKSLPNRVLKNWDLFWYSEISLSIRGGSQGASLGFGLGQNPSGAMITVICKLKLADLEVVKHDHYYQDVFPNNSTNCYNPAFLRIFVDWKATEGNS